MPRNVTDGTENAIGASTRRTIGVYPTYAEAERAVDRLADAKFPVERVAIVGTGIRWVEQVTGRMSYGKAALLRDGTLLEATISVAADEPGGTEAEGLPLASITHEDGDHQIAIGLGGRGLRFPAVLWHFVDRPRQV